MSVSSFVPKPFTPFQWFGQNTQGQLFEKQMLLKDAIKNRYVSYNWHDSSLSILEGVFARGDRKLSKVLVEAHRLGAKFDSWHEFFNMETWQTAFANTGIDPSFYNERERSYEEILPWDHIDIGVSKAFLMNENEKAKRGEPTANCREKCAGCGVIPSFGGGFCG